ncbi:hypothetical protein [Clostridioides difficile]|uniref:hypothetical protein n=1 Tax=Clostridioides difficile TaxID=1496 RepID=UPI000980064B|nr:hypothetical protein [Clostridioides difficile]SJS05773.1 Uncharacterised protein [Clostridioides difficile]
MNLKKKEKIVKPVLKKLTEIVLNILSKKILNYAIYAISVLIVTKVVINIDLYISIIYLLIFYITNRE